MPCTREACQEAEEAKLLCHNSKATFTQAVPHKGRLPAEAKWLVSDKVNSEGMLVEPEAGGWWPTAYIE